MIKKPASQEVNFDIIKHIQERHPDQLAEYMKLFNPVDHKGRYLAFDEFYYRVPKGLDTNLAWSIVKASRHAHQQNIYQNVRSLNKTHFMLTPNMQRVISLVDRYTTSAQLELISTRIGEKKHFKHLIDGLVQDEAISSSQLEGAATTTIAAKKMLKKRKPRTMDERMILGNFRMMIFAWKNKDEDLSLDFIQELHKIGTEDIDNDKYWPGLFRNTDDVVVEDRDGNVVHQPPSWELLEGDLKSLCDWANQCHDDEQADYLHPIIKAIALHFAIGFEHPFRDGNGRVARALFYWYLFKKDYGAFRYISISVLLKKSAAQYGKSYLYTETDGMDLTYFLDHQCKIINESIQSFRDSCNKTIKDIEDFNVWMYESGLFEKLNDKQKVILQVAKNGIADRFTINEVAENLGCAYNTAANTLNGLVKLQLFKKKRNGREWEYQMKKKKEIISAWN